MALEPEAARKWRDQAQFDYIGPFVKSWAAFNAWFRHGCGSSSDADGLAYVTTKDNPVRNTAIPLLNKNKTNDRAQKFKANIADLHERLSDYDLNKTDPKTGTIYTIRLSSVRVLNQGKPQKRQHSGDQFLVHRVNKKWRSEIKRNGNIAFEFEQDEWDADELVTFGKFIKLSQTRRTFLQATYNGADPCPLMDLTAGVADELPIGDVPFRCTEQELFSGLVRVLYDMRNSLLHGELVPNETALRCYEPAYWLLRDFLAFAEAG